MKINSAVLSEKRMPVYDIAKGLCMVFVVAGYALAPFSNFILHFMFCFSLYLPV